MDTANTSHFSLEGAGVPALQGLFADFESIPAVEYAPGLSFQTLAGASMLANLATYRPGAVAPLHAHVEEQIVIVLEGEFHFTIDGVTRRMLPGDVAVVPSWVPHAGVAGDQGCKEIDIFSPPRATLVNGALRPAGRD